MIEFFLHKHEVVFYDESKKTFLIYKAYDVTAYSGLKYVSIGGHYYYTLTFNFIKYIHDNSHLK